MAVVSKVKDFSGTFDKWTEAWNALSAPDKVEVKALVVRGGRWREWLKSIGEYP